MDEDSPLPPITHMTPLWGPGPTGDHRLHLPTKPQGYEGRGHRQRSTPPEEQRGAELRKQDRAGPVPTTRQGQSGLLSWARHVTAGWSGEEAGLSVTQGHGKLPTAGLVCNCQLKEPPTQARTPLYFYARG